ncbi:hypothetical protein Dda_1697 [Drechslerella dactyloides]|uniref:F-box domain-containing protein n=1 Tax=Drechslerella dactyloides TaxID=74499 RepID=A0AAD6NM06_DREDA|nr:hypothetical protein Dda_1697 [Drechslerella dactyloides]
MQTPDTDRISFTDIPSDIFAFVLDYLSFRDLISLSLTTRGLRYIQPRVPNGAEDGKLCSALVTLSFLPPRRTQDSSTGAREGTSADSGCPDQCPYCQHTLCTADCETSLFLDSATGVFFPRSLYLAKLKRSLGTKRKTRGKRKNSDCKNINKSCYSTIWCEHHRCPSDLLARPGAENNVFIREYNIWSLRSIYEDDLSYLVRHRWLAGQKLQSPHVLSHPVHASSVSGSSAGSNAIAVNEENPKRLRDLQSTASLEYTPVYEKVFYDKICRHCLLVVPPSYGHTSNAALGITLRSLRVLHGRSPPACQCDPEIRKKWPQSCVCCGHVSVRVTKVEVFDDPRQLTARLQPPRQGFWLHLATEYYMAPAPKIYGQPPPEGKRMYPVDAVKAARHLQIVRGTTWDRIIPLPPPSRLGIHDLPHAVLNRILGYLPAHGVHIDENLKSALLASNCFLKSWLEARRTPGQLWVMSPGVQLVSSLNTVNHERTNDDWELIWDTSFWERWWHRDAVRAGFEDNLTLATPDVRWVATHPPGFEETQDDHRPDYG